ncbi:hypothetical protein BHM03_00054161 [Ensete ventricosum]|nr:hypothetical protein BHM03_00054161 [Ensete ventricosum]
MQNKYNYALGRIGLWERFVLSDRIVVNWIRVYQGQISVSLRTGRKEARASEGFIASSPSSDLFGACVEKMGAADAEIEELLDRKKPVKNPLVPVGTSPPFLFPFSNPNPPILS